SGPDRITPPCPLHAAPGRTGEVCGGCDWQHLDYAAQLRHKTSIVRDCVERIAKLKDVPVLDTLASPSAWAYRNKVMVPFGRSEDGSEALRAGFYAAGSHRIVDFSACPVQTELSVRIVLKVKALAAELGWRAWDERSGRGCLRHVFVRTNNSGRAMVTVVTHGADLPKRDVFVTRLRADFPEITGIHHNIQPQKTSVILGPEWHCMWGARYAEEKLGRFSFQVSPGAFLQVNSGAAEKLYDATLAALSEGGRKFDTVLDLYCGVGTLTLWLTPAAGRVLGVEENRDAVRDAWKNAERNSVRNVRFSAGRAEAVLPRLFKEGLGRQCAAVVDPPRSGMTVPVLRALTNTAIRRIVYVSCNPATFARDAGFLAHSGFSLVRVQPVDLFPQTSHVELVALLDRGPKDPEKTGPQGT
ncbi:MAG: 23S rRNA (uracil(1939)-C(5))-methyltransferase RlmD, partial [Elusimicrobiota bacterium]